MDKEQTPRSKQYRQGRVRPIRLPIRTDAAHIARLDALAAAWGLSRTETLERLIREAPDPS